MIIPEGELERHLGNSLDILINACNEGKAKPALQRIKDYDVHTQEEFHLPVLDYLLLAHQIGNRSIITLADEVGVSNATLTRVFNIYNLPRLTWEEQNRRRAYAKVQEIPADASWEQTEYRGLPDLDYKMALFVRLTSQHFLNKPFTSTDVRTFLNQKRHEDGRENPDFYYSPTFSRWLTSIRSPLTKLYNSGALERLMITEVGYPDKKSKTVTYRYASHSLADLGVQKS